MIYLSKGGPVPIRTISGSTPDLIFHFFPNFSRLFFIFIFFLNVNTHIFMFLYISMYQGA